MPPKTLLDDLGVKTPAPKETGPHVDLTQVILVDDREKRPMPIPAHLPLWITPARKVTVRLVIERAHLKTADYALGSAPTAVGIERKANLDELHTNLVNPAGRRRFLACLDRLSSEFSTPILFLEGTPTNLVRSVRSEVDPDRVRDLLMAACSRFGISLFTFPTATIPQRRVAGEWLAALLVTGGIYASGKSNQPV